MRVIEGKYTKATIYSDYIEENTLKQVEDLCNQEFTSGSKICLMPDAHAGYGCTVGTSMTVGSKIVPNIVGVDIGCGMEVVELKNKHIEVQRLDKVIRESIPSGSSIRKKVHSYSEKVNIEELRCLKDAHISYQKAFLSLGSLGGGNHFIEIDKDKNNRLYLIIHSGSRYLGLAVANYYQEKAYDVMTGHGGRYLKNLIEEYKNQGRHEEIPKMIADLEPRNQMDVSYRYAYVSGRLMEDYLHDMAIVQEFADINRQAMARDILKGMKLKAIDRLTCVHNYIDMEAMILRKGAVSAKKGQDLLIPLNMKDGAILATGKGNIDWNMSAPHGAGRLMSRKEARERLTLSDYKKMMEGIYSTSVKSSTLDESPMAYKSPEMILEAIQDTVSIKEHLYPIYNFKAN